jgi:bifunctional DNA-binding transcriptional regulator/antitoxin component of YhaV-PrlF toxin-antitoxin module
MKSKKYTTPVTILRDNQLTVPKNIADALKLAPGKEAHITIWVEDNPK